MIADGVDGVDAVDDEPEGVVDRDAGQSMRGNVPGRWTSHRG